LKNSLFISILFICFAVQAKCQIPKSYDLNSGWSSSLPRTNTINDILITGDTVWFGTEHGLSCSSDAGSRWTHFSGTATFDDKGISALAIRNGQIWVATGYSTKLNDQSVQTGGGLHYSTDRGVTWSYIPQPVDVGTIDTLTYGNNKIRALAITVPQQNITFDIALSKNTVWIASWAGMLRKSTDMGQTWNRVILPPDNLNAIDTTQSLSFDLSPVEKIFTLSGITDTLERSYNYSLFSVYASNDSTIWAGTAGGINKSTDGGLSWRKFTHQNQIQSISGNFVVALHEQRWQNRNIIWASTINANDPDETKGVSYSDDGGNTWKRTLLGEWSHNIASKDSLVYIATDNGIFRSSDFGTSWTQNGTIYDPVNLQRFVSEECYGVGVQDDMVWYGGSEGSAYTYDSPAQSFGTVWKIFRTAEQVGNENRTYAFPNPFAPDDEPVRIHFSTGTQLQGVCAVTIRIFNFSMQPVRTLLQNASRLSGSEYDEIWDGRDNNHSLVANGVYFYRLDIQNQESCWGKIMVLH
jgi:hypothetical protein